MFGISGQHIIILIIVILIFGPKRLPELARTFGKAMRNFRDGLEGVADAKYRHLGGDSDQVPGHQNQAQSTSSDAHNQAQAAAPSDPNDPHKPA
jgi:TatA/E family protein of Tat protein translocase